MSHSKYTKEELESMSTVMLLSLLKSARAQICIGNSQSDANCEVSKIISQVCVEPFQQLAKELKEVLSTREHIPNKQERRIKRQEKQKEKQNR